MLTLAVFLELMKAFLAGTEALDTGDSLGSAGVQGRRRLGGAALRGRLVRQRDEPPGGGRQEVLREHVRSKEGRRQMSAARYYREALRCCYFEFTSMFDQPLSFFYCERVASRYRDICKAAGMSPNKTLTMRCAGGMTVCPPWPV